MGAPEGVSGRLAVCVRREERASVEGSVDKKGPTSHSCVCTQCFQGIPSFPTALPPLLPVVL